jgi:hypothetical protein
MSKIEVNTIEPQCGTTLTVGKCTTSVAVPGNVVKSNALQASDGGNIVSQSGTTVTLGASGDSIALASGATQTGFGRTGTVDWVTTPKVTGDSPVTAATGSGYFLNTTAGQITINLPAGAAGSIVSMADYAATWQTNKVTVTANGSEKIGGDTNNATLNTVGQSVTFVYVDSTQGWVNTMDSTSNVRGAAPYVAATGGTPCSGAIVCTNYKVHTFTGPGTLCVSQAGTPSGSDTIDYLVIAGGAGGGRDVGGGGAAGGYRESSGAASGCYTIGLPANSGVAALPLTKTGYPVTVGAGGTAAANGPACGSGTNGADSVFTGSSTITSTGGGLGGAWPRSGPDGQCGGDGGSGGGASGWDSPRTGGTGNTPPVSPSQGNNGGNNPGGVGTNGGGGGGAGGVGIIGGPNPTATTIAGGPGATSHITASPVVYGVGGTGGGDTSPGACTSIALANSGSGGGGAGNTPTSPGATGTGCPNSGNLGGSGVVVIRYKFQ